MKKAFIPLVGLVCMVAGCSNNTSDTAVLAGTWTMDFTPPVAFEVEATFDSDGVLTTITATPPVGDSIVLTVTDSTSTVDGSDVTITIPTAAGSSTFTGTLSSDQTSMTGSLSQLVELPSGDLTVPAGDVTFTLVTE